MTAICFLAFFPPFESSVLEPGLRINKLISEKTRQAQTRQVLVSDNIHK